MQIQLEEELEAALEVVRRVDSFRTVQIGVQL